LTYYGVCPFGFNRCFGELDIVGEVVWSPKIGVVDSDYVVVRSEVIGKG
jgi:hypothetical protein